MKTPVIKENARTRRTTGEWLASAPKINKAAGNQTYFSIQVKYPEVRSYNSGERTYVGVGFYYPHSIQTPEEMQANAEFICKAANNHDKLIAALDAIVNKFGSLKEAQQIGIEKELMDAVSVLKQAKQ